MGASERNVTRSLFCIELEVKLGKDGVTEVNALTSIAGREGTFRRSWLLSRDHLDTSVLDDVAAHCAKTVVDAVVTGMGIHDSLPF